MAKIRGDGLKRPWDEIGEEEEVNNNNRFFFLIIIIGFFLDKLKS